MRRILAVLSLAAFSLSLPSCQEGSSLSVGTEAKRPVEQESGAISTEGVPYASLDMVSGVATKPLSLCDLVNVFDGGAGIYVVKSLTGFREVVEHPSGSVDGFTYVELELIEAWTENAPLRPVARITGGPAEGGLTRSWFVGLSVNEVLGVFLFSPTEENRGYYGLHPVGIWRGPTDRQWSNGQLYRNGGVDSSALGAMVSQLHSSDGHCPFDVRPDMAPSTRPVGQPDQVYEGEANVELER